MVRRTADGWHVWICCHPLDAAGEEDRMTTAYATSADGLAWTWHGTALAPRPGTWDARGTRLTALLPGGGATHDGRASKEENFGERTGLAGAGDRSGAFAAVGGEPVPGVRYLDVVAAPGGGHRIYYEAPLPDGSHELRTEQVSAPPAPRVDVRLSRHPPVAPRARYSRDGSQLLWRPTAAANSTPDARA